MSRKPLVASALMALLVMAGTSMDRVETTAQILQPAAVEGFPPEAEFPGYDSQIWRMLRSGHIRKLAARRFEQGSYTPETVELLLESGRVDDALRVTRLIVDKQPTLIARAFEAIAAKAHHVHGDRTRDFASTLHGLIDDVRKLLPGLSREEAARTERQLLWVDGRRAATEDTTKARLRRLANDYAGTETALLAEVDLIREDVRLPERLDRLDAFAREHAGTAAGAKALFMKGSDLGNSMPADPKARKGEDPTERFMRVLGVVRELKSGSYPRSEWVERAPSLVTTFFSYEPVYAPANVERVMEAITAFAADHFVLNDEYPDRIGVGSLLTRKVAGLSTDTRAGIERVGRVLLALERQVPNPDAVRYLKAQYFIRASNERNVDRAGLLRRAREILARLSSEGADPYRRRAHANLAFMQYRAREYVSARDRFREYLAAYPDSDWAWVAALRIGRCNEALREWKGAVAAYQSAARTYAANPVARVLGQEYSARAREALREFEQALAEHQAALGAWDDDFGREYWQVYSLFEMNSGPDGSTTRDKTSDVSKASLEDRVAQLRASLSAPGGPLVERGRWLLQNGQRREALAPLAQAIADHPRSPALGEARVLSHRARLEIALDSPATVSAAELEALAAEPLDFPVFAAKMARASALWKRAPADGEAALTTAFEEWRAYQKPLASERPLTAIERDVLEIRNLVFLPRGGEFVPVRAWQRLQKTSGSPYFVVNPEIAVLLAGGDTIRTRSLVPFPPFENVIFLDAEQLAFLREMTRRLGPRKPNFVHPWTKREPALWDRFFPWIGWESWDIETYPVISRIEFMDRGRTKACALIRAGHEGGTVLLEKIGGKWTARALVNTWIS